MIISFACNNIGTGGAERVICNLANQMAKDGHLVRIICYEKTETFYYTLEHNVSIVELDSAINKREKTWQRKLAGIVNLWKLYCALKGSDRVISFYTRQNCYSILVSRLQRIPVICAERDHFFINDGKVNHIMRKIFYPHANGFIHQTKLAQKWLRDNEGVRCRDVVIPNPLWILEYPRRDPVEGRIVAVGRLAEQKNYEGIIQAFSIVHQKIKESKLYIYGDGPYKQKLINLSNKLGVDDSVSFMGMTKDVISAYKNADIYVIFSHGEGYPNALMEALSMGVPSISSDCLIGGPRDMITDGKNGSLVSCGDIDGLANRMLILLEDKVLKEKYSGEAVAIRESNRFDVIYKKYMDYIVSCDGRKL